MKAVIFDLDGVIVDSERYWKEGENRMFHDLIPGWKEEDHHRIVGMTIDDTYAFLQKECGLSLSFPDYIEHYDALGDTVYEQCSLIDGVASLMSAIHARGFSIGIASSAPRKRIMAVLTKYDLGKYVQAITCADDIPAGEGKPQPTIYRKAAGALHVPVSDCIAIEDATNGILSAKAAGMYCMGLHNGVNDDQDLSPADMTIDSLKDFPIGML